VRARLGRSRKALSSPGGFAPSKPIPLLLWEDPDDGPNSRSLRRMVGMGSSREQSGWGPLLRAVAEFPQDALALTEGIPTASTPVSMHDFRVPDGQLPVATIGADPRSVQHELGPRSNYGRRQLDLELFRIPT